MSILAWVVLVMFLIIGFVGSELKFYDDLAEFLKELDRQDQMSREKKNEQKPDDFC